MKTFAEILREEGSAHDEWVKIQAIKDAKIMEEYSKSAQKIEDDSGEGEDSLEE